MGFHELDNLDLDLVFLDLVLAEGVHIVIELEALWHVRHLSVSVAPDEEPIRHSNLMTLLYLRYEHFLRKFDDLEKCHNVERSFDKLQPQEHLQLVDCDPGLRHVDLYSQASMRFMLPLVEEHLGLLLFRQLLLLQSKGVIIDHVDMIMFTNIAEHVVNLVSFEDGLAQDFHVKFAFLLLVVQLLRGGFLSLNSNVLIVLFTGFMQPLVDCHEVVVL